jgi:hypothetical protein
MTQLTSLKISIDSLLNETNTGVIYLDSKITQLIFNPAIIDGHIDGKAYCSLYVAIRKFANEMQLNDNTRIIKEKIRELPLLTIKDFRYETISVSAFLLYILFPVGIVIWISRYVKINALTDKLRDVQRTLNTAAFMLRALTESKT